MSTSEFPSNLSVADFNLMPPTEETFGQFRETLLRALNVCDTSIVVQQQVNEVFGDRASAYATVEAELQKKTIETRLSAHTEAEREVQPDHSELAVKVAVPATYGRRIRHYYAHTAGFGGGMDDETYKVALGQISDAVSLFRMVWLQDAIDTTQGARTPAEVEALLTYAADYDVSVIKSLERRAAATPFKTGLTLGILSLRESTCPVDKDSNPCLDVRITLPDLTQQRYKRFPNGNEELHVNQRKISATDDGLQTLNALVVDALDKGRVSY